MDQDGNGLHPNWGTVVAVGVALVTQTAAAIWWASAITTQLSDMRDWQQTQDGRLARVEALVQTQEVVSGTVNTQMLGVRRDLDRIEKAIEANSQLLRNELNTKIRN